MGGRLGRLVVKKIIIIIIYSWENLQLILEVYQFARDAAVAEQWLIAQEPYLMSSELGHTIDDVENLIKKHEAFEKSAAAQEERFSALERLTTVFIIKNKCFIYFYNNNCKMSYSEHDDEFVLIIFIV